MMVTSSSFSQQQELEKQHKVALVLSGGGAKGLAHIGVLKVLEEVGIKPDIITGTSMGSIVAALYAVGYTADELSDINKNADWSSLLTDRVDLLNVSMDEKPETKKYLFEIPIKENKIDLPAGLIEGQHLESYFSDLFWPLTSSENFDSLPIPFHCMSVDLVSGKTVEHRSGNLVQSIRASMAIPTVFSPVHMDSMLLVDGGVTCNFPVQEAIDMGADIIIGVYLGYDEDVKPEDLSSLSDVLQRSMVLGGIIDAKKQFDKCNVLIIPDLGKYTASDFSKGPFIQYLGEQAARKHIDELKALVEKYHLKNRQVPKIDQPKRILISDIKTEGLHYMNKDFVLSKSGIQKGDSVRYGNIDEAIDFMYGTHNFNKLSYSLQKNNSDNGYVLTFHAKESPRAMFKVAPAYDNKSGVGIVTNFTLRNIVAPNTRMLISLNIAENPGAEISLNKFIGKRQRLSDCFHIKWYHNDLSYYSGGEHLGNYKKVYFEGGYGLRFLLGLDHEFGIDGFYKYAKFTPGSDLEAIFSNASFSYHKSHELGYDMFYKANTTDDLYFPHKGIKLEILFSHALHAKGSLNATDKSAEYFVNEYDNAYATLMLAHDWYTSFAKKVTYDFGVSVGMNTNDPGTNGIFMLGGYRFGERKLSFFNLAGFNPEELYTYNFASVRSSVRIELLKGFYLNGTVNVVNTSDEFGDLFEDVPETPIKDYIWGYNIGVMSNSFLGPIQFSVGDNNMDGKTRYMFSIGFPF
jgi:NTE family protein